MILCLFVEILYASRAPTSQVSNNSLACAAIFAHICVGNMALDQEFVKMCCVDAEVVEAYKGFADRVALSLDLDRLIDRGLYVDVVHMCVHVEYLWEFLDAVSLGGDVDGVGLRTGYQYLLTNMQAYNFTVVVEFCFVLGLTLHIRLTNFAPIWDSS